MKRKAPSFAISHWYQGKAALSAFSAVRSFVCGCLRLPCGIPPSAGPRSGIPQGESAVNTLFAARC